MPTADLVIPVCFGGAFGPDLASVGAAANRSVEEVVRELARTSFTVERLGFLPGFGYLRGVPECCASLPRRATPRPQVAAGTFAIANGRAGVYPFASPGGWHLLGRTPLVLFDPHRDPPALLAPGMRVGVEPVDRATFAVMDEVERESAAARTLAAREAWLASAGGGSTIEVLRPGMLTLVVDAGREGYEALGVGPCGPMDQAAFAEANALLGNAPDDAALEITIGGPTLRFVEAATVVVTGAELPAALDGVPRDASSPLAVPAGAVLALGSATRGCRAYLAVAGGLAVQPVLGSATTHLRAGFGGHEGRPLRAGDRLLVSRRAQPAATRAGGPARASTAQLDATRPIRLHAGPALARLGAAARSLLFGDGWRLSPQSDRMGYRLDGSPLILTPWQEMPSAPVTMGTVQLPADGYPIILMADRQTTGGYPVLARVHADDLPLLAQRRPGDALRFVPAEPA